jgi:hypothetical protein
MANDLVPPKSKGRPKGAKNKTKALVDKLETAVGQPATLKKLKKVFEKVVEMAMEGDTSAQKMLMDRFLPIKRFEGNSPQKSPSITINIDQVKDMSEEREIPIVTIEDAEVVSETKH